MSLTIRTEAMAPEAVRLRRMLVAVDDSYESRRATQLAALLARQAEADVVVVHFREVGHGRQQVFAIETVEEATRLLKEAVDTLRDAGVPARVEQGIVPVGSRAAHIQELADRIDADLIVMGTRGLGMVGALFMGSVSHQVIRGIRHPVLLVP